MRLLTFICDSPLRPGVCDYYGWYPVLVLLAIAAAGLAGYVIGRSALVHMLRGAKK